MPPLLQWFLWFFVPTLIACVGGVLLWRYKMMGWYFLGIGVAMLLCVAGWRIWYD